MTRQTVIDVLHLIRPGARWQTDGDTFADVVWLDEVQSRPSDVEFDAGVVELAWVGVRRDRDRLLSGSDWTQMPDSPLDAAAKQEWAGYRQTLRDIPQDFASPDAVVWPEQP